MTNQTIINCVQQQFMAAPNLNAFVEEFPAISDFLVTHVWFYSKHGYDIAVLPNSVEAVVLGVALVDLFFAVSYVRFANCERSTGFTSQVAF